MRRLVVAAGIAVALAVGLWLGLSRQHTLQYPTEPLAATATLAPRTFDFADRLTARFDVLVDPRAVDPASVRVQQRFGLFHLLGAQFRVRKRAACCSPTATRSSASCPGASPAGRWPSGAPYRRSSRTARSRAEAASGDPWPTYIVATHLSTSTPATRPAPARRRAASAGQLPDLADARCRRCSPRWRRCSSSVPRGSSPSRCRGAGAPPDRSSRPSRRRLRWSAPARSTATTASGGAPSGGSRACCAVEGQGELAGAAVRLAWSSDPPSADATSELADEVEASL